MPCPKCKKKTASTWSFCPYCGAELPPNEKLRRGRIRGKGEGSAYKEANGKWVAQRSFGVAVNHKTGKGRSPHGERG